MVACIIKTNDAAICMHICFPRFVLPNYTTIDIHDITDTREEIKYMRG